MKTTIQAIRNCIMMSCRHRRSSGAIILILIAFVWIYALAVLDAKPTSAGVRASEAVVSATQDRTEFRLRLSDGVTVEVFTLADPYRVVIDLPDVTFQLPKGGGARGDGVIKAFRYGLFAPGKARIVLDTAAPVWIEGADMIRVGTTGAVDLKLTLVQVNRQQFGRGTGPSRTQKAAQAVLSDANQGGGQRLRRNSRPVVVIDPGHGGVDPGAVADGEIYEKNIVLSVGNEIVRKLKAAQKFDVHITRSSDVFVSLDDRLSLSRRLNA
ncbi:MAG: N-acetylmuramoyl-L-alanine amidase, partial [Pseudomonadota bacterium]